MAKGPGEKPKKSGRPEERTSSRPKLSSDPALPKKAKGPSAPPDRSSSKAPRDGSKPPKVSKASARPEKPGKSALSVKPKADKVAAKRPPEPEPEELEDEDEDELDDEAAEDEAPREDALAARSPDDVEGGEAAPVNQLGSHKYVLSGFFAAGILGAFVLGSSIGELWAWLASKDWFANALPAAAALTSDDTYLTISMVLASLASLFVVLHFYRKPEVKNWSEEVASELSKVKWPTKKEVTNSTVVVIAASAVAILYLYLLDNFWGFVTDRIYGQPGS